MTPRYFFSGDHHFWHKNIIKPDYSDRTPFMTEDGPDIVAMNEKMIEDWNAAVTPDDVVCYAGDLCFGGVKKSLKLINSLNGKFLYVRGNHDNKAVLKALDQSGKLLAPVTYVKEIEIQNQHIVLSHCAFRVWFESHHGSWNVFGHSHGSLPEEGKQMDIGVDAIAARGLGYTPVPFEYIRGILDSRKRHTVDHHK